MRTRLRQRFGTLRWKLVWSYVWVTALISILLNIVVFIFLAVVTPKISAATLQALTQQYADDFAPLFASEPTQPLLATALRYKFGASVDPLTEITLNSSSTSSSMLVLDELQQLNALKALPPHFFTDPPTEPLSNVAVIVLLDPQGQVLAGTFPTVFVPGQPLADPTIPTAQVLVRAAARNEDNLEQTTLRSTNNLAAAAPIRGADGAVQAVLYIRTGPLDDGRENVALQLLILLVVTTLVTLLINSFFGLIFGWFAARNPVRRIKALAAATAVIANGDLSQRVSDSSVDEIGQLGQQFNAMADQLESNIRSLRQFADHNAALAEQATQLATIEERNRLARDLHDSVSQELFSVTMLAAAARNLLPTNPEKAQVQLHQLSQMAQRALHETRALIFALRPAALGNQGLAPALRQLRDEATGRLGLQIDLQVSGERRIPLDHEQALFRITQEALANVAKHSGAHAALVKLEYTDGQTCIQVRDQGRGFDLELPRKPHSLGLISIGERAAAVSGTCQVTSMPNEGTTVRVCVPHKPGLDGDRSH